MRPCTSHRRANGVWYYQRRIPQASQPFFNHKTSIKTSLRTTSKADAIRKARLLSVEHDKAFAEHRELSLCSPQQQDIQVPLELMEKHSRRQKLDELGLYAARTLVASQRLYSDDAMTKAQRESCFTGLEELLDNLRELATELLEGDVSDYDLKLRREWQVIEGALSDAHYSTFTELSSFEQRNVFIQVVSHVNHWLPVYYFGTSHS